MDHMGDDVVPDVRRGVRLGVDVGDVRIGVARSDPAALLATPVETVAQGPASISRLLDLAIEHDAIEVIVGLPRSLSGRIGPAAVKTLAFARGLYDTAAGRGMSLPVRLVDERLTTVSAERMLRERGKKGSRRRAVVDQAAAVVILQHAIDTERSTGRPPGQEVSHTT
jgi:putative Holliday junction resolvase